MVYYSYMKKQYVLTVVFIVFITLFWWLNRNAPALPPVETTVVPTMSQVAPAQKEGKIIVSLPLPESTVPEKSVQIKGTAVGNWFFEASAPVNIVNWDGLIIGEGYVTVDEGYDWMTTEMVPFTGTVSYDASQIGAYSYGWIIMQKNNPSGESKFDDSLEFKIVFPQ